MTMKDKLINVIIMNEKFEYLGETTLEQGKNGIGQILLLLKRG